MPRYFLTFALLLAVPGLARTSQIAVGIDWRHNVFVQEFWQDGKARYAIFNNRPDPIKLTVHVVQFVNAPGTEGFRIVDGKDLSSWEVKSKAVVSVDVPAIPVGEGLRFMRFRIAEGPSLGVLTLPTAAADLPTGKIISCDGMNGSGGRQQKVFYEQDSLTFKSDGIIEPRFPQSPIR